MTLLRIAGWLLLGLFVAVMMVMMAVVVAVVDGVTST